MKKLKRGIAILITVFILSTMFIVPAYASEITQDGLKAEIILEKDNYSKNEEIPVKIVVTNTNDYDVQNVSIEGVIPKGLTLVDDTATKSADLLQAGATLELTYILKSSDTANNSYKLGDVNDDGDITATDARLALRISAQLEEPTDIQIKASDTDNNGKVTASDARKILRVSAKLDSFKENTKINNKLLISSLNISNTKTGKVSVIPLAVNSAKTIAVKNTSTADISKNIGNYLGIILGVCLIAVAICTLVYFLRKNKTHTKRTLLSVLCALIVLSTVAGTTLFIAIADNAETTDNLKSFTVSEIVTVDGTDYSINNKVRYNHENEDNQSEKAKKQMSEVNNAINEYLSSDNYKELENVEARKEAIEKFLVELSEKGTKNLHEPLITKDSIEYDEQQGFLYFEHICGIKSFIMLKPFSNNLGSTENKKNIINTNNSKLKQKIGTERSDFQCDKSIMIYGWDNETDTTGNYSKWVSTVDKCKDRGMNMSVITHTTVNTYRTILLENDFICIAEHGAYYKDIYGFCVYGDAISDDKNNFYEYDILNERILQGYDATVAGETRDIYIITPKFFKYYYGENTLRNSIIFLSSCMGFGSNGNINYEFAKAFVDECGASACVGFHNSVWLDYANDLLDYFTMYLSLGYNTQEALNKAKEFIGDNDKEYVEDQGSSTVLEYD